MSALMGYRLHLSDGSTLDVRNADGSPVLPVETMAENLYCSGSEAFVAQGLVGPSGQPVAVAVRHTLWFEPIPETPTPTPAPREVSADEELVLRALPLHPRVMSLQQLTSRTGMGSRNCRRALDRFVKAGLVLRRPSTTAEWLLPMFSLSADGLQWLEGVDR